MEVLHLPDNIKVHFAGAEQKSSFEIAKELGVRYFLYTAFPYVKRLVFGKASIDNMDLTIPRNLSVLSRHVIQDSGLFTLMFGALKGKHDAQVIGKWYDKLVEFTLACNTGCTVVEVDCQKVLGAKEAWNFRERMKKDLPNNRIINVFHIEDGQKGLDKLIEFSEYIAISVPEMRFAKKKDHVIPLVKYIKKKKPSIDIHLLGCTELSYLRACNFCTSSDSTTYNSPSKFGFIKQYRTKDIKENDVIEMIGVEKFDRLSKLLKKNNLCALLLEIERLKQCYELAAGNQDYYK